VNSGAKVWLRRELTLSQTRLEVGRELISKSRIMKKTSSFGGRPKSATGKAARRPSQEEDYIGRVDRGASPAIAIQP